MPRASLSPRTLLRFLLAIDHPAPPPAQSPPPDAPEPTRNTRMRYLNLAGYLAIPLAFLVHLVLGKGKSWEPTATFSLAALAVIPLARLMGTATEHLSSRAGPTWGG